MDQDVVLRLLRVVRLCPKRPVVGNAVREEVSGIAKSGARDGQRAVVEGDPVRRLQPLLGVFVPEVPLPIRACGGEGVVLGVERDRVHRVDQLRILIPVAFKRKVALVVRIDILDRYPPFD